MYYKDLKRIKFTRQIVLGVRRIISGVSLRVFLFKLGLFAPVFLPLYAVDSAMSAQTNANPSSLRLITSQVNYDYSDEEVQRISLQKTVVDASKNGYFANTHVIEYFSEYQISVSSEQIESTIPFRLHVPPTIEKGRRYPLLVIWHGSGESDDDDTSQLAHLQYGMSSLASTVCRDCFILATQCPRDNSDWTSSENRWQIVPIDYTIAIIRALEEIFPIAQDRISALGICSGASAVISVQRREPTLLCALALCSYSPSQDESSYITTPVWLFGNQDDKTAAIEPMRQFVAQLHTRGIPAHLSESQGGHDSWTHALRDAQILTWLACQRAHSLTVPPPSKIITHVRDTRSLFYLYLAPILLTLITTLARAYRTSRYRRDVTTYSRE